MSKRPNILLFMVDEQRYPTAYDGEPLREWMKTNLVAQTLPHRGGEGRDGHDGQPRHVAADVREGDVAPDRPQPPAGQARPAERGEPLRDGRPEGGARRLAPQRHLDGRGAAQPVAVAVGTAAVITMVALAASRRGDG
jgi:hypothetical protein